MLSKKVRIKSIPTKVKNYTLTSILFSKLGYANHFRPNVNNLHFSCIANPLLGKILNHKRKFDLNKCFRICEGLFINDVTVGGKGRYV